MSVARGKALDLAAEMIPSPRRALRGLGVVKSLSPLHVTLRGFAIEVGAAIERRGFRLARAAEGGHELLVERVLSPFPGVPAAVASEAYRCAVGVRRSVIQAADEQGAWNGVATFLEAAAAVRAGGALEEVMIEDWPGVAWRGVDVPPDPGIESLRLDDWQAVLDELASLKLNALRLRAGDVQEEGLFGRLVACGRTRGLSVEASAGEENPEGVSLEPAWRGPAYDPASGFDLALAAERAWNPGAGDGTVSARLLRKLGGERVAELERGLQALELARQSPAASRVSAVGSGPGGYPLAALEATEAGGPAARSLLEEMQGAAELAAELLGAVGAPGRGTVGSLLAEAVRWGSLAGTFLLLLDARAALGSGRPLDASGLPGVVAEGRGKLTRAVAVIESRVPAYLFPASVCELGVLRELLGQLEGDCAEVVAGRRAPATVRWLVAHRAAGAT